MKVVGLDMFIFVRIIFCIYVVCLFGSVIGC